ncbi:hypothetical protein PHYPSEUDO_003096 [Phytophthora pseudosyringae]|uniref:WRKY19-like zinc finger domain-containing protein n=1 Tax=Phytophthora pseudosyringae TaxID=221518 RepID=A0A8T1WII9_9STRA|nr:hypothetical protein PHYPSEUDO_003096 [Phytophthora pseudosyringae]
MAPQLLLARKWVPRSLCRSSATTQFAPEIDIHRRIRRTNPAPKEKRANMFQLTDAAVMHHRAQFPLELCRPPAFAPSKLSLAFPKPESDTTSVASTTPSEASSVSTPVLRERMSLSFITHPDPARDTQPQHALGLPQAGVMCSKKNCYRSANSLFGAFCEFHKPSRLCKVPACRKCAKTGGFCISHGGGRRCRHESCLKSAKEGGYCIAHGGGKRCREEGCSKSALAGGLCSAHGGGKRCSAPTCCKTALKGGLCIAHGGGRRCEVTGCTKSAVGGHLCVSHGGGRRCREADCNKGAVRRGVCIRHGARQD